MMPDDDASIVELAPDGDDVSLELAPTHATVGAWWVYRHPASGDDYELLGEGETEREIEYDLEAPPDDLVGDRVTVILEVAHLKSDESHVGAAVAVHQGDEQLDARSMSERAGHSRRFDFAFRFREA